jgi:XTP/dITP diphosphohydrolase
MAREILFATTNPHKKERFQAYYEPLGLKVISFSDIKDKIEVVEDGKTPEENALKKALAGYNFTHKPTFGIDYWLRIEGFPENLQPGPFVRRIFVGENNQRIEANDEEMLNYYINKIKDLGGRTKGTWTSAIALVVQPEKTYVDSFSGETIMTSKRSTKITKGEPLNSIQIDPKSGKYFTDLTTEEWLNLQKEREKGYITFMKDHLLEIV